jgi:hypothetical protein
MVIFKYKLEPVIFLEQNDHDSRVRCHAAQYDVEPREVLCFWLTWDLYNRVTQISTSPAATMMYVH